MVTPWLGQVALLEGATIRGAPGAAGVETLPGSTSQWPYSLLTHYTDLKPAQSVLYSEAAGAAALTSLCAGGNSGQAGFLGMCLQC